MSVTIQDPMMPTLYKINNYNKETQDMFTINLRAVEKGKSFKFMPGQFCMLHLFGLGEVAISISGDPAVEDAITHTIRNVGLVTKALMELEIGATIGVRGPFGTPWPIKQATGKNVIIMTGGIGLAPLRPVIYTILANRKDYNNVYLFYGARTPGDVLYTEEVKQWMQQGNIEVHLSVDQADANWQEHVGTIVSLFEKTQVKIDNAISLVCGPEVMINFSVLALEKLGLSKEEIYISMERNMQCGVGYCGHCMHGGKFLCKDGPVLRYDNVEQFLKIREL